MARKQSQGKYQVVWPRGKKVVERQAPARRLDSLNGKTVAELWDFVFRGEEIFPLIESELSTRFEGVKFLNPDRFGNTHSTEEREVLAALPDRLRELGVDAVISGMGCWGSCTPAVMRAAAVAERAGIPSVSLVCQGFAGQASSTAAGLGFTHLPVAVMPGHVNMQTYEELKNNILDVTVGEVVRGLVEEADESAERDTEPQPRAIVFTGSFEEVNDFFYNREWSDGLPIVPPTIEKIERFLRFNDRDPDEVLGVLLCDRREATIWNIAANGVMAGCRPEYMPVLIAIVEALADPKYGLEHSGNTPGPETLIILNGPIIKQLGFNYEQGALRDGFRANISIGRFLRLYLRNVAGFLPHKTDKGTFGGTWRVVMAENEDVLAEIGWEPLCADMGFKSGDNVVTIARYTGGDTIANASGTSAGRIMPYIADAVLRANLGWHLTFTCGMVVGTLRPLVALSPLIARTIAKSGWSKGDVRRYLFDHARIPAHEFDKQLFQYLHGADRPLRTLEERVRLAEIPKLFCESSDPNRMVPIVVSPDDFMVTVCGDPSRDNAYAFSHNGFIGYPTAKQIKLPKNWGKLLK